MKYLKHGQQKPCPCSTNTPEKSPAVTVNNYGKGRAIYVAVPAQMSVLAPLVRSLYSTVDIENGPETPPGFTREWLKARHST